MNISGEWQGVYGYLDDHDRPVEFLAVIRDHHGVLSGNISEPNVHGVLSSFLYAQLEGKRDGVSITFIKSYDGCGDYAHCVFYEGSFGEVEDKIEGKWTIEDYSGWFYMNRNSESVDFEIELTESVDG